jgi:tetratricopeptide (TPR) repeat protein
MRQGLSLLAEASGKTKECLSILLENYNQQGDTEYNLLNYQIGNFLLYQLNPNAKKYLAIYKENQPKEPNLNAERSLYWYYIITNQQFQAETQRQTIITTAQITNNEQARYIMHELEADNPPNIHLLKARLLTNGGYYQDALKQIKLYVNNSKNPRQNTEYHYRKARIMEKLGNTETAKIDYKKAILSGKDQSWYFAPQASLNLGKIYNSENKKDLAKHYFKLCLKINNSLYKESINREAKRNLKQIQKSES